MPKGKSGGNIESENLSSLENMEKLTKIMNDIFEESVHITQEITKKTLEKDNLSLESWVHVAYTYKDFFLKAFSNPQQIATAQITYWENYLELWQKARADPYHSMLHSKCHKITQSGKFISINRP